MQHSRGGGKKRYIQQLLWGEISNNYSVPRLKFYFYFDYLLYSNKRKLKNSVFLKISSLVKITNIKIDRLLNLYFENSSVNISTK